MKRGVLANHSLSKRNETKFEAILHLQYGEADEHVENGNQRGTDDEILVAGVLGVRRVDHVIWKRIKRISNFGAFK